MTLKAAWDALVEAVPKGARTSTDVPYARINAPADDALTYAMNWRAVALSHQHIKHLDTQAAQTQWLRVAHAAEDLATAALEELRHLR